MGPFAARVAAVRPRNTATRAAKRRSERRHGLRSRRTVRPRGCACAQRRTSASCPQPPAPVDTKSRHAPILTDVTMYLSQDAARFAAPTRLVTRADALAAGISAGAIRHRIKTGQWQAVRRGIYAILGPAGEPVSYAERVQAAVLALGPGAVASHQSAALLHGIAVATKTSSVFVTRPPTCRNGRHLMPGIIERSAQLPSHHVVVASSVAGGVAATSPARTLVDLARHLPFEEALPCVDSALRQGLVTIDELEALLEECGKWPGAGRVRPLLRHADARSESALESMSRGVMILGAIPLPELQCTISDADGFIARLDFLWSEDKLAGEADGRGKYDSPAALWAEKRREDRVRAAGFGVTRWGWIDVTRDRRAFVARLRQLLGMNDR
jgi:hypothetical protein